MLKWDRLAQLGLEGQSSFSSGAMGNKSKADSRNKGLSIKPVAMILVIAALSLATWYFFHIKSMPLTPAETTVVVFIWGAVVVAGKWLWAWLLRKNKSG